MFNISLYLVVIFAFLTLNNLKPTFEASLNTTYEKYERCRLPWWRVKVGKCARLLPDVFRSYEDAQEACRSLEGGAASVLSIDSTEEQEAVEGHLASFVSASTISQVASNLLLEDFWLDTTVYVVKQILGDPSAYDNYEPDKEKLLPVNKKAGNLSCTVVNASSGKWSAGESCLQKRAVVCEQPLLWSTDKLQAAVQQVVTRLEALEAEVLKKKKGEEGKMTRAGESEGAQVLKEKSNQERLETVKEMARSAWQVFTRDKLRQKREDGSAVLKPWDAGRTVVGALSTLHVMGLTEEFEEGKKWLLTEMAPIKSLNESLLLEEITNDYFGGLLSLYALSGGGDIRSSGQLTNSSKPFLDLAAQVAKVAVEPAYNNDTRLPYSTVNPSTGQGEWEQVTLSVAGGAKVESAYLRRLTTNNRINMLVNFALIRLSSMKAADNSSLYRRTVDAIKGVFLSTIVSLGAGSADFYRGLVLASIQFEGEGEWYLKLYTEAMEELISKGAIRSSSSQPGRALVTELNVEPDDPSDNTTTMTLDTCYLGGLLALGAKAIQRQMADNSSDNFALFNEAVAARHRLLAEQVAETCYQASTRTATKLAPALFSQEDDLKAIDRRKSNNLNPNIAETHFYLYRLTGDEKYRERAWEMVEAIQKYCKTDTGTFAGINDVTDGVNGGGLSRNGPEVFFFSATLKYLYLTFAPLNVFSLDKWIFNAAGHPLPIL